MNFAVTKTLIYEGALVGIQLLSFHTEVLQFLLVAFICHSKTKNAIPLGIT